MKNEKKNFIKDKTHIMNDILKIIINIYGMRKALKNKIINIDKPIKCCLIKLWMDKKI